MLIRHVRIRNFRGIATLDWPIRERFVVLVGPGDAGKTTVFEAIDLALGRQWYTATDADFHGATPTAPIEIEVTVGELPPGFADFHGPGLCLHGWRDGVIHDEPEEGDESVVTVRLVIDASLEPVWTLTGSPGADGFPLRAKDRAKLRLHRLGGSIDHQLGWGRGSLLARQSDARGEINDVMATAARSVRQTISTAGIPGIQETIERAKRVADQVGVEVDDLKAAINAADLALGGALLSLHDGNIPVRQLGLGSRRLLAVGLELDAIQQGGIGLIDEIEHGLEPYRIHTLLEQVKRIAAATTGQAFVTTHSAVVIQDCGAVPTHVVRTSGGRTTITKVPVEDGMQALLRGSSDAVFAKKVIVCEGKTEYGMCRGLDAAWTTAGKRSFAASGCVPVNGNSNSEAALAAMNLRSLGYDVCFFGDSDQPCTPSWETMVAAGIEVNRWKEQWAIEDAVFRCLPWADTVKILTAIGSDKNPANPSAYFKAEAIRLGQQGIHDWDQPCDSWSSTTVGLLDALLEMSRGKGTGKEGKRVWLKHIDIGTFIGHRAVTALPTLAADNELRVKMERLRTWIDA
jgi:putative ATP-dependent endonuclease of OLD family